MLYTFEGRYIRLDTRFATSFCALCIALVDETEIIFIFLFIWLSGLIVRKPAGDILHSFWHSWSWENTPAQLIILVNTINTVNSGKNNFRISLEFRDKLLKSGKEWFSWGQIIQICMILVFAGVIVVPV